MDLEIWTKKSISDLSVLITLSLSLGFTTYSQYLFVPSNLLQKLSKVFFRYILKPSNVSWAPLTISAVWPLDIWPLTSSFTIISLQPTLFCGNTTQYSLVSYQATTAFSSWTGKLTFTTMCTDAQ